MSISVIRAALNGQEKFKGNAYMFNGQKYIRYDWINDDPIPGYPYSVAKEWKLKGKFAHGIDAAINGLAEFKGNAYFFKGNEYIKYNWEKDAPVNTTPSNIAVWKFPDSFNNGIDAACNGRGKYEGYGYFFKGSKYIKYDWKNNQVLGVERELSAWKLPGDFNQGIEAALNGDGEFSNFVYFFKGDRYIRYDWFNNTVEGPWSIKKEWQIVHNKITYEAKELYDHLSLNNRIDFNAFRIAYAGYKLIDKGECLSNGFRNTIINRGGEISGDSFTYDNSGGLLTIIDFTKPSNESRCLVIDVNSRTERAFVQVAHGLKSAGADNFARNFSNTNNSNKSSLGFFVTGKAFYQSNNNGAEHRTWLKLYGIEEGINHLAEIRQVMMHTATYVHNNGQAAGTSLGCPAISEDENEIVNGVHKNRLLYEIANGNLVFAYTTRDHATNELGENYYDESTLLHCLEYQIENSFGIKLKT